MDGAAAIHLVDLARSLRIVWIGLRHDVDRIVPRALADLGLPRIEMAKMIDVAQDFTVDRERRSTGRRQKRPDVGVHSAFQGLKIW